MTITSRHDNSATILAKIKQIVNVRPAWTRESTAFDMGRQSAMDDIRSTIVVMERTNDTNSND